MAVNVHSLWAEACCVRPKAARPALLPLSMSRLRIILVPYHGGGIDLARDDRAAGQQPFEINADTIRPGQGKRVAMLLGAAIIEFLGEITLLAFELGAEPIAEMTPRG